jgi:hypothetical protein
MSRTPSFQGFGIECRSAVCRALTAAVLLMLVGDGLNRGQATESDAAKVKIEQSPDAQKPATSEWTPLFNGKDLDGWKVSEFGGQGEVVVENGEVVITQGTELSGIHTEKKLPRINYEVEYEAQRAAGSDFFAGLTFPVRDSYCSLILGGWGGGVCGLSNLNGMNASENQTTSYQQFETGTWYRIRLVVTEEKIEAWINDSQIVDVETADQKVDVDFRIEKSCPFGFATWQTTGRIRNARIRSLPKSSK